MFTLHTTTMRFDPRLLLVASFLVLTTMGNASPEQKDDDPTLSATELRIRATRVLWFKGDFKVADILFQRALALKPVDFATNLFYAMACMTFRQPHDPVMAEKHLEIAQKFETSAFTEFLLGYAAREAGDTVTARSCWKALPGLIHSGKTADIAVRTPDSDWGRQQYDAMLKSLPEMKLFVRGHAWLEDWAIAKFGGQGFRTRVVWNKREPLLGGPAETEDGVDADDDMGLMIRRRPDADRRTRAEIYWSSFVFEMLNDDWRERYVWIWMRARAAGKMDQVPVQVRSVEQVTGTKVCDFYFEKWKPYCKKLGLESDPGLWSFTAPFPEEAIYRVLNHDDQDYTPLLIRPLMSAGNYE